MYILLTPPLPPPTRECRYFINIIITYFQLLLPPSPIHRLSVNNKRLLTTEILNLNGQSVLNFSNTIDASTEYHSFIRPFIKQLMYNKKDNAHETTTTS